MQGDWCAAIAAYQGELQGRARYNAAADPVQSFFNGLVGCAEIKRHNIHCPAKHKPFIALRGLY